MKQKINRIISTIITILLLLCLIWNTPVQASTEKRIDIRNKISQLALNESYQFSAKISDSRTTRLVWKSNAPSIASISMTGKVTAKAPGNVTITVTDLISKKRSYCTFRVRQKETPVTSLNYAINDSEIIINGMRKECSSLVLPEKINGLPVTQISRGAFYKNTKLTLVDLPTTLEIIEDQAFHGCTSLTTIYFPETMTKLGNYLFYDCKSLASLSLPKKCSLISERVFTGSNLGNYTSRQLAMELDSDIFLSKEDTFLLKQMKELLNTIVSSSDTDVEKARKIHDWITTNCTYDTAVLHTNSTIDSDSHTAYGVINNHKAICSGYAEAFDLFMKLCDIPSIYIVGKADGIGHAWNLVKLSDHWYHIDTTWDDPIPEKNILFYNYFLLNDAAIEKTHTWNKKEYPACTSDQYLYYVYKDHIVSTLSNSEEIINNLKITSGEWTTLLFPCEVNLQRILSDSNLDYEVLRYYHPKPIGKYISYTFCIE